VPESEVAQAIRDAFTTHTADGSVAEALYEVSNSLDRIAAAIEANHQSTSHRTSYRS
jgi:hypothetical protein